MYGLVKSSEEFKGSGVWQFGLNQNVNMVKFEFNPNGGKDGAEANCLDVVFKKGEGETRLRIYEPDVLYKDNVQLDKNSEDYKTELEKQTKIISAVICDIVLCFVSPEQLEKALASGVSDFKSFVQKMETGIKKNPDWDKKNLDLFMQYSYNIRQGQNTTFLEVPNYKTSYHGLFIVPTIHTGWKEVKTETSLTYVDDKGEHHPFKRGSWFLGSNFANRQTLEGGKKESEVDFGDDSDSTSDDIDSGW